MDYQFNCIDSGERIPHMAKCKIVCASHKALNIVWNHEALLLAKFGETNARVEKQSEQRGAPRVRGKRWRNKRYEALCRRPWYIAAFLGGSNQNSHHPVGRVIIDKVIDHSYNLQYNIMSPSSWVG